MTRNCIEMCVLATTAIIMLPWNVQLFLYFFSEMHTFCLCTFKKSANKTELWLFLCQLLLPMMLMMVTMVVVAANYFQFSSSYFFHRFFIYFLVLHLYVVDCVESNKQVIIFCCWCIICVCIFVVVAFLHSVFYYTYILHVWNGNAQHILYILLILQLCK